MVSHNNRAGDCRIESHVGIGHDRDVAIAALVASAIRDHFAGHDALINPIR